MDVVLCVRLNARANVALVAKDGKLVCEETINKSSCRATLIEIVEEVAPRLANRSRCHIVAASIQSENDHIASLKAWITRDLRSNLHTTLGIRTLRVCELKSASLPAVAQATWDMVS